MPIHSQIASFASKQGAVYIGVRSFSRLALGSYRTSLATSMGKTIALSPTLGAFAVRFDSAVTTTSASSAADVQTKFEQQAREVSLCTEEPLRLVFSLGILAGGAVADVLGTLTLEVSKIRFAIDAGNESLTCAPGESTVVPSINRATDFEQLLIKHGLDRELVVRIEGMLLFSGLATAFSKMLSSQHSISLKELFPNVRFNGHIEFKVSADAQFLFLKGTQGLGIPPDSSCSCADVGTGIGPVVPGNLIPNAGADPATGSVGKLTIGGPTKIDPNIPPILGLRRRGEGDSGLYLPADLAFSLAQGPYPGVRLDISDNGFIGWKAAGFVDFNGAAFTMDAQRGRFFVDLQFRAEVYGSVHVDLGKLGKIRVTEFSAEQAGPGVNSIRVAFYLVLGTNGLYLKPVLEDVKFSQFEVNLRVGTLIGTPFGVWGAVIGFIFDKILGNLIGSQIPNSLDLELRRYMAKVMIPLLNANYAAGLVGLRTKFLAALFEGDSNGILMSVGDGG
jgi:hypothetical protein